MKSSITDSNTPELLEEVKNITEQAANAILRVYETNFNIENKEDRSPLTAADTAAHQIICQHLKKLTPNIPILSEESADIPYATRQAWARYWLVDPLDGTREFIKRNGEFTVNIALIDNHQSILGVIYVPVTKLCYYAARNYGAYKQEANTAPAQIHVKTTIAGNYSVAGSRSHGSEAQTKFIENLGDSVEMIAIGSSLKFCLVAEGKVDIYPRFGPTSEWDTAAAQCIVEEAGGSVTDMEFNPLRYNLKESTLNPNFLVIADKSFDWKPYLENI